MKKLNEYRVKKIRANVTQIKKSSYILLSMTKRNVKAQYRNSVLGILWTVLNPLLNMLVMAMVFGQFFGRSNPQVDYPVYVLAGNTVFGLMRMTTQGGLLSIVSNYDLLTKTRIPHRIFPVSQLLSSTVNFGFAFIALIIVMLIRIPKGVRFHATGFLVLMPWLPAIMLFSLGIALFLSAVYVRFRDIKHLYGVLLTLWTYLTPLFYFPSMLGKEVAKFLELNPMYHYVDYFRTVMNMGVVPDWKANLIIIGTGLLSFLVGVLVFRHMKKKFILYI